VSHKFGTDCSSHWLILQINSNSTKQ
jgi:hypothetical protein